MANVVKSSWFGRNVQVLMVNGKRISGEITEVSDSYVVLNTNKGEIQVMVHAIIAIWPGNAEPSDDGAR